MLPGQSLHILGCGIEKLVGQVSQGPGDRDLVPNLWHGRGTGVAMTLSSSA